MLAILIKDLLNAPVQPIRSFLQTAKRAPWPVITVKTFLILLNVRKSKSVSLTSLVVRLLSAKKTAKLFLFQRYSCIKCKKT